MPESVPAGGNVKVERDGAVAILTLAYPERRNALSLPVRTGLAAALEAAFADETCRAIVLTGEGAHFCAGGDITSFGGETPVTARTRMHRVHPLVRLIVRGETPVIAAVEGHAAGAGLCLAAASDIFVAARDSKLSCGFSKIGLLPDCGGLWSIPMRIGLGKAKLLMMTGRVIDGAEGERQGLVDVVAEPGQALNAALEVAREVARTAPLANGLIKAALARAPSSLEEVLAGEADAQGVLYGSDDFTEGMTAFLEKRAPVFRGR